MAARASRAWITQATYRAIAVVLVMAVGLAVALIWRGAESVTTSPAPADPFDLATPESPNPTPTTTAPVPRISPTRAQKSSPTVGGTPTSTASRPVTARATSAPRLFTPAALNAQWDGSYTITTSTRPWAKEWRGNADGQVSGGQLTIPASGDYHRIYYTARRFGGPGKPIVIRMRKRATNIDSQSGGTIPSAAIWYRVPKDGVDKNDYRNAFSDNDPNRSGPSSSIIRDGIGKNGRVEVMAYDGMNSRYVTTGSNYSGKSLGYTPGTERDVTLRGDWISKDRWRWRVWHSAGHDMTEAPVYDWTGYAPHQNEPGFFAFRTDFLDAHYKYVTLPELRG